MGNLEQSPESQRMGTCKEYSVSTLDALNLDCLLTIFHHLPLLDLLCLRHQCRSLNDAVCKFLQNSCRKLELNLDADRSGEDLERVIKEYNHHQGIYYLNLGVERPPEIHSITFSDTVKLHLHLFKNQPHFRSEDMIQVNSAEGATDRKVDSLVAFLTIRMPNLRSLALLVSHVDYFRSVARLLSPLKKLKVFLIDANSSMAYTYDRFNYPGVEIAEAICDLPKLESLYYFRNYWSLFMFGYDAGGPVPLYERRSKVDPHQLSCGVNFLEILLPRLRVLHCHFFPFPVGEILDKLEELSIDSKVLDTVTKNYFPAVETLFIHSLHDFHAQLGDGRLCFVNVKILKLDSCMGKAESSPFFIGFDSMRALNDLPNLEELHCRFVDKSHRSGSVEPNKTIVRLYTSHHPSTCSDCQPPYNELGSSSYSKYCTEPAKMAVYADMCKKYFQRLQLFRNEHPPLVRHFPPEIVEYKLEY